MKKSELNNIPSYALFLVGILGLIATIVLNCVAFGITNDVDGWIRQASVTGDVKQMAEFCDNAVIEMDRLDMHDGYKAWFPKNAEFDMAVTYKQLVSIRDRAFQASQDTELYSISQSQVMIDLRTALQGIRLQGSSWYLVNHGWLTFFYMMSVPFWFGLAVIGVVISPE